MLSDVVHAIVAAFNALGGAFGSFIALVSARPDVVNAIAAAISAVFGVLAALAAFQSAKSARDANRAVQEAERRASLRSIGSTATEVILEAEGLRDRAKTLKIMYSTLATFAGQLGGSRVKLAHKTVDEKLEYAAKLLEIGRSHTDDTTILATAPIAEIDSAQLVVTNARAELRALRQGLELELSSIEGQIDAYRSQRS
jgi:hypothetical protein